MSSASDGNKDQEMRQMFLQAKEPELKKKPTHTYFDSNFEKKIEGQDLRQRD